MGYGAICATQDAVLGGASTRDGESLADLETLYAELEKVRRFGFNPSELERVKTEWMRSAEKAYDARNDVESGSRVGTYLSNFSNNTPMLSDEMEFQLKKQMIPMIDLNSINAIAQQLVKHDNQVVVIRSPEKEGVAVPSEDDVKAMLAKVNTMDLVAYEESGVNEPLIPEGTVLKGSPIAKVENGVFGSKVWTLKNGIKVVFKPTDFKADELRMSAIALGGTSNIATEDMVTASFVTTTMTRSGVGNFSLVDLQKQLAGKSASISLSVDDYMTDINGSCSPKDVETMFQL